MNRTELVELAESLEQRRQGMGLRLLVCCGTPCVTAGAEAVVAALRERVAISETPVNVDVVGTGCLGPCSRGPLLTVQRRGETDLIYERITAPQAVSILDACLGKADVPEQGRLPDNFPFFSCQIRVVLANSGRIDPEDIRQYISYGGYGALAQVLHESSPQEDCDAVEASGLRGRGLPHRPQIAAGAQRERSAEICGGQRRRRGSGGLHGSLPDGVRSPSDTGGDGDCRIRHGVRAGIYLCAGRVSPGCGAAQEGDP